MSPEYHPLNIRYSNTSNLFYSLFSCCIHPYVDVTYTLVLKRQPGYYVYNIIMPSLVITLFALFIFAFPEATGERIGLAIQCFLTVCILTMMVGDLIPIDSNVTPLLGSFMLSSMVMMTMSISKYGKLDLY